MVRMVSAWWVSTTHIRYGRAKDRQAKRGQLENHKHRLKTVQPYEYKDAATLLEDFWAETEAVLRERGVKI